MARGRAGVPHPRSPARPDDPIERFRGWLAAATRARSPLAEAVVLATADRQGRPSARYVLLRAVDERGFVFSTDARSRKAKDLRTNRHAALTWYWPRSARQARIEGRVEEITAAESDAHWQAEPRANQLLVSVCRQSAPLESVEDLSRRIAIARTRFAGRPIPRPREWVGFRIVPARIEFWIGGGRKLHQRIIYQPTVRGWRRGLLQP
jgi:pyridoxamine 5'-phosphate oxidase